ncbi:MAG: hypothetical protein AAGD25_12520 [Cyanobacteria bacterium P01_F01_bin.150]
MSCPLALVAASLFKSAQGHDSITPSTLEYLLSVRAFSEESYGIPRQNVIGSATIDSYDRDHREVIHS